MDPSSCHHGGSINNDGKLIWCNFCDGIYGNFLHIAFKKKKNFPILLELIECGDLLSDSKVPSIPVKGVNLAA